MKYKEILSTDKTISKFIFNSEYDDNNICVEAILYKYPDFETRTVLCISTQCGCPIGCTFCGTGKHFVRNLTRDEIVYQVDQILSNLNIEINKIQKLQIMFMSMGEPFLNYDSVSAAIINLHKKYPNAQLLISTVAPKTLDECFESFTELSKQISQIGIQFSVHESTDDKRFKLLPKKNIYKLNFLSRFGNYWASKTGRKPFFNYCVTEENNTYEDIYNLRKYFNPIIWEMTLSVICSKDENMKDSHNRQLPLIKEFSEKCIENGYSTRIFNPGGDDIGGGCGQLFAFQNWFKENKIK